MVNNKIIEIVNKRNKHILINLKKPSPAHKVLIKKIIKKEEKRK